ncbi:MAG: hypothetical protein EA350_12685 [Gemmatimonadales bacterium]|nr:MAG: hypothetical protein EA350_12685 [Gemmatimonadales bacterium]
MHPAPERGLEICPRRLAGSALLWYNHPSPRKTRIGSHGAPSPPFLLTVVSAMPDRKSLGEVLQQYGRVSPEEQEAALAYQRSHGGYFGEALVALGMISPEELEFGLAAQFNLPYVFPDADSIDLDAAELVSPEWALANLTLPIARSGETLSVIVDSPIKPVMVQELEARTGLEIELAIASPSKIRELIRHVFGGEGDDEEGGLRPAASVDDFLDEALASGASRFGVSLRARTVMGWWEERGRMNRRHLTSGWPGAMDRRLSPGLNAVPGDAGEVRDAELEWGGTVLPVRLRRVVSDSGEELLLDLRTSPAEPASFDPPPTSILDEVRLLARSGAGRFVVRTRPETLASEILPHLPRILLGPHVRAVHLREENNGAGGLFALGVPSSEEEMLQLLTRLQPFRMEAITADLPSWTPALLAAMGRSGGAVFVRIPDSLRDPAFGWRLEIFAEDGGRLRWQVRHASSERPGS